MHNKFLNFVIILLIHMSLYSDPVNDGGLMGIHKTHSAQTLGKNFFSLGLSTEFVTDESIFKDGAIFDGVANREVQKTFFNKP